MLYLRKRPQWRKDRAAEPEPDPEPTAEPTPESDPGSAPAPVPKPALTGSSSELDTARQVESHGRAVKKFRAVGLLIAVAVWWGYLWCSVHPADGPLYETPLFWVLVGAMLVLGVVAVVRWLGSRAFDAQAASLAGAHAGNPAERGRMIGPLLPRLIICCSGGGIKSASFCLGALERLARDGNYRKAEAVVAVSGGSYIAAAFALHRAREDQKKVVAAVEDAATAVKEATAHLAALSDNVGRHLPPGCLEQQNDVVEAVQKAATSIGPWKVGLTDAAAAARSAAESTCTAANTAAVVALNVGRPTDVKNAFEAVLNSRTARQSAAQATLHAQEQPRRSPNPDGARGPAAATKAPDSMDFSWIAPIRRLTNYLVSSPRVRSELVLRWLFGVMIAVVIVFLMLIVVAWLLTEIALYSGLVTSQNGGAWCLDLEGRLWPLVGVLFPGIVLLSAPVIQFAAHFRGQVRVPRPWRPRGAAHWTKDRHRVEFHAWLGNVPATLFKVGCLYFFSAAVLLAAWEYHSRAFVVFDGFPDKVYATLTAVVVAVGGYVTSLRSAFKGLAGDPEQESVVGQALAAFRQSVAPILAKLIFLLLLFVALTSMTSFLLSKRSDCHLWWLGAVALLVLAGFRLVGQGTLSSLYPFYRDRLNAAYLDPGDQDGDTDAPPLSWLENVPGEPRLVLCATANIRDENLLPTGRLGTPFILGDFIGTTDTTFTDSDRLLPASAYEEATAKNGRRQLTDPDPEKASRRRKPNALTLADAVAISGAALAPVLGRDSKTIGRYRLLLALANIRLGVWLPNPYWVRTGVDPSGRREATVLWLNDWLDRSSLFQVVEEAVGTPSLYSPYLYVTDGGHYDNLGLVEALRRRPDRIIMLDGSGDAEDEFPAMGMAMATARTDLGVDVEFDPSPMVRGTRTSPQRAWVRATATYRDTKQTTSIEYLKSVLPAGLSWDLDSYQKRNPGFPATSQKYETFDEFDFEAYRQLGWSIVEEAIPKDYLDRDVAKPRSG